MQSTTAQTRTVRPHSLPGTIDRAPSWQRIEPGMQPGCEPPRDSGAVTAEYAIATIAAVGFAALLVVLLRSDVVRGLLTDLIRHALAIPA